MNRVQVNIGDKYGKLYILKEIDKINDRRVFECRCECGKVTKVLLKRLRGGHTKSCGCIIGKSNIKHGKSKNILYKKYFHILDRCNNPKDIGYKNYGGRGIKCEWKTFEDFYKDMGESYKEGLTIDRINVNGNYCKENCRWATYKEQANNRRNNIIINDNGNIKTAKQMSEKLGIKYTTFLLNLNRNNINN